MGNPLFENLTPTEILQHLVMRALDSGATVTLEGDLIQVHSIGSQAPATETAKARTTGDPKVDRWERLIASGVNPFTEDIQAAIGEE